MNQRWHIVSGVILTSALLMSSNGCKKEDKEPPAKIINLRVVMVVETGANLDSPPSNTGGCKLTKSQVTAFVNELVAFGNCASPSLKFSWNGTVEKLESDCLKIQPPPFPPCMSQCALGVQGHNCPRLLDVVDWFAKKVVNQTAGGEALLQQNDMYINDRCTINIYFVGNLTLAGGLGAGWTLIPGLVPVNLPHFVVINDLAFDMPSAPVQFNEILVRKVLIHEVVCHWVRGKGSHASVQSCENNLCTAGPVFDACRNQWGGTQPTDIPTTMQTQIDNRLQQFFQCGGSP